MNETVITVKTPRGLMKIVPEEFFPTTKEKLRKLIKIINDPWTGEGTEKKQEIQNWINDYISLMERKEKFA